MLDIAIIGAGWSGLYAGRYARKHGLSFTILERREDLGGVWNFSKDRDVVTTMSTTVSTSSRTMTEASDFPMPEKVGHFFHWSDALEYLNAYADEFRLREHLKFGASVIRTERDDDGWTVSYEQKSADGATVTRRVRAKRLAVCTGVHSRKRLASGPIASFGGELIHSGDIKAVRDLNITAADHVIVYGGGETASDMIDELAKTRARVTWAISGGQHFYRRTAVDERLPAGVFDRHTSALDINITTMHRVLSDIPDRQPGIRVLTNLLCTGSLMGYQGHGVPEWSNDIPTGHAFFNKAGHSVEFVRSGRVKAAGAITKTDGNRVTFESGESVEATRIIYCFGYQPSFPFLPEAYRERDPSRLLQLIFDPVDPTLAFFGLARPTWSSLPFMTELQCGYAFKVFAGEIALPETIEERVRQADAFCDMRAKHFPKTRLNTLVDPVQYYESFVKLERNPVFTLRGFLRAPWRTIKLATVPISPRLSRCRDDADLEGIEPMTTPPIGRALRFLECSNALTYVTLCVLIIPLCRLLRIDDIADWFGRRKLAKGRVVGYAGPKRSGFASGPRPELEHGRS